MPSAAPRALHPAMLQRRPNEGIQSNSTECTHKLYHCHNSNHAFAGTQNCILGLLDFRCRRRWFQPYPKLQPAFFYIMAAIRAIGRVAQVCVLHAAHCVRCNRLAGLAPQGLVACFDKGALSFRHRSWLLCARLAAASLPCTLRISHLSRPLPLHFRLLLAMCEHSLLPQLPRALGQPASCPLCCSMLPVNPAWMRSSLVCLLPSLSLALQ